MKQHPRRYSLAAQVMAVFAILFAVAMFPAQPISSSLFLIGVAFVLAHLIQCQTAFCRLFDLQKGNGTRQMLDFLHRVGARK